MTKTTSYVFDYLSVSAAASATANGDVTGLANGGFAYAASHGTHMDGAVYSAAGFIGNSVSLIPGQNAAMAGLSNGNFVLASQDADSVQFELFSGTASSLTGSIDIGSFGASRADVAALTGGKFVIVDQKNFSATDNDIEVNIFSAAGAVQTSFVVTNSLDDDRNATVIGLDNGNFAVAWNRMVGGASELWTAVYTAAGVVVKAPALIDNNGSVNADPSIVAIAGGFVVAYADNGWGTGTADITLAKFTSAGVFAGYTNVSNPGLGNDATQDANPAVARLSNGLLAVSWDNNFYAGDTDVAVALVDPTTMTTLTQMSFDSTNDQQGAAVASFGAAHVALTMDNLGTGQLDIQTLAAARIITSDAAGDTLTATDDMVHHLIGNGGNDNLKGGVNADTLDGGSENDKLAGGGGNDDLYGRGGTDQLDGGAGADTMQGGDGNDTYIVDDASDSITENAGEGTDSVKSSVSFLLGANLENLTLTGAATIGNGNALNNKMIGNGIVNALYGADGNDTLDGKGGADFLFGGAGNDKYVVDDVNDQVFEDAGEGNDSVSASVSFTLSANVEKLTLTGLLNINGDGNDLANSIGGNKGDNVLHGGLGKDTLSGGDGADKLFGGAQADKLTGGAGADQFNFDTLTTSADKDTITDFVSGTDKIGLDRAVFVAFSAYAHGAAITGADFHIGASATAGSQNLIYDNTTGALYYDADGLGGAAQIQIAALTAHPGVAAADFFIL